MSSSVIFNNVTKKYKMYRKTSDKLLDIALPSGYGKDFYALQDISFTAEKGDVIGVIGINGSGKSTLSNLISGVIPPTSGEINILGDVSLISIATGLNNQLSGRENIELKCLMLGFSKQEITNMMPEIIDFADIGDFIDQPVKKYSSGMKSRLGFAISVTIDPDILVIDEALSVGDKTFADKSLAKMNEFKERGKTIFFISHSIGQIKEFCQKALWLEGGEIKAFGQIEEVVPQYEKFIKDFKKMSKQEQDELKKQINERRSKKKNNPQPVNKSKDDDNNSDSNDKVVPPSNSRIRRKRGKSKFWLIGIFFVALLGAGVVMGWDKLMAGKQSEDPKIQSEVTVEQEPPKINTEEVKEPAIIEEVLDIRYVNVSAAFVRDTPDMANSNRVNMLYFGQAFYVSEIKKDPVEDFQWLKLNIEGNQEVWISEQIVTKLEVKNDGDSKYISTISELLNVDLSNLDSSFALTEENVPNQESNQEFSFDQDGKVDEITYNLNTNFNIDDFSENTGAPDLRSEESVLLYHGENYDFVVYADNFNNVNTLVIRPVITDKDHIVNVGEYEITETDESTQTNGNVSEGDIVDAAPSQTGPITRPSTTTRPSTPTKPVENKPKPTAPTTPEEPVVKPDPVPTEPVKPEEPKPPQENTPPESGGSTPPETGGDTEVPPSEPTSPGSP